MPLSALPSAKPARPGSQAAEAYIELLKQVLTRFIGHEEYAPVIYNKGSWQEMVFAPFKALMAARGYVIDPTPAPQSGIRPGGGLAGFPCRLSQQLLLTFLRAISCGGA